MFIIQHLVSTKHLDWTRDIPYTIHSNTDIIEHRSTGTFLKSYMQYSAYLTRQ